MMTSNNATLRSPVRCGFARGLSRTRRPGARPRSRRPCPHGVGARRGAAAAQAARGLLVVALDRLHQDPLGVGLVAPAGDLGPLALLERLVVLEEVPDALAVALRQVLQVLDLGLERVDLLDRHGDQLVVHGRRRPPCAGRRSAGSGSPSRRSA